MPGTASPRPAVADPARLAAVASYRLAGHAGDPDLDGVVEHMARSLRAPIAVVNLVGPDRQCYAAERGVGAPSTGVPDELSFCAYVVSSGGALAVADAREHPVFSANPLVQAGAVTSYLGVPLVDEDGLVLGSLSVFDAEPRAFTAEERGVLEGQARLVRALLSLRRRVQAHEWDSALLAVQGRALEAVATGGPLTGTLALLADAERDLARGADDRQAGVLAETVERLRRIAVETDGWRRATERLARQDGLTGLANRAHLAAAAGDALVDGGAVLFVDLDHLKEVNDRGGHALGDGVLVRLADRLRARVLADVPDAVVGRVGGDEFAAVLPGVDRETARGIGERLVAELTDEVECGRRSVRTSASIGLAMAAAGTSFADVLAGADAAMYRAKALGRGRLHELDDEDVTAAA